MPVRFHPGDTVPKGLKRDEVLRLLATSEGDRPADVRDRAILMVLIAYGLRAGEVASLGLDDVDWAGETLRVRRSMLGRTQHYPHFRRAIPSRDGCGRRPPGRLRWEATEGGDVRARSLGRANDASSPPGM